jgi:hypothetical protein
MRRLIYLPSQRVKQCSQRSEPLCEIARRVAPHSTKERRAAARLFNYRPGFLARVLRAQRTHTLGVLAPELSEGYSALVLIRLAPSAGNAPETRSDIGTLRADGLSVVSEGGRDLLAFKSTSDYRYISKSVKINKY